MASRRYFGGILLGAAGRLTFGQDWPQWRGPNRDGAAAASGEPKDWPEKLRQVWTVKVGEGHSSPVVSGTRVFQFARTGNNEALYGFDLATGKKLFEYSYEAPYEMNSAARAHGKGPKSTPLVSGGRVYTLGMSGVLSCVDAQSGKSIWRFDSQGKFRQTAPLFGVAMSPIIHQAKVIVHLGTDDDGAITAFDPATGKVHWQTKGLGPAYSSPVVAGTQIVTCAADKMFGLRPTDGHVLWQFPFTTPYSQNSVTPFVYFQARGHRRGRRAARSGGAPPDTLRREERGIHFRAKQAAAGRVAWNRRRVCSRHNC